ncbi:polyketide synthase dehydratase domain-containing protein [Streptomyces tricolor]|nr:polyketide synthase dehydratase domain-containing protein [Streptomyces tricolor]
MWRCTRPPTTPPRRTGRATWTRHATGILAPATGAAATGGFDFTAWPPPGAQRARTDGLYAELVAHGHAYGPLFQGLRGLWRRGDELFAEAALAEEDQAEADRYGVHPALLDAVLTRPSGRPSPATAPRCGSRWSGTGSSCTPQAPRCCAPGSSGPPPAPCRWRPPTRPAARS